MKEFKLEDLLQYLQEHQPEVMLAAIIALAIILSLFAIFLIRVARRKVADELPQAPSKAASVAKPTQPAARDSAPGPRSVVADELPETPPKAAPVAKPAAQPTVRDSAPELRSVATDELPKTEPIAPAKPAPAQPKPSVQEPAPKPAPVVAAKRIPQDLAVKPPRIPQESVLRRHHLTHVRTMLETVTFPQPTESVLRRHYEQLVSSQVEECLQDEAKMQKLLDRYDEYRREAAKTLDQRLAWSAA